MRMNQVDVTLEERLRRIRFIVCDVDGVLTDGQMWFDGEGRPFRALHARDAAALTLWHLSGGKTALVSGLGSQALAAIANIWKCCETHEWIRDKARVCREMAERHGIALEEIPLFLGTTVHIFLSVRSFFRTRIHGFISPASLW